MVSGVSDPEGCGAGSSGGPALPLRGRRICCPPQRGLRRGDWGDGGDGRAGPNAEGKEQLMGAAALWRLHVGLGPEKAELGPGFGIPGCQRSWGSGAGAGGGRVKGGTQQ